MKRIIAGTLSLGLLVSGLIAWHEAQPPIGQQARADAVPTAASDPVAPTVANLTLTSANTEYSQVLPQGVKHFSIQCRAAVDVRYAFVTGKVAGSTAPYMTMKSGSALNSPEKCLLPGATTVYMATSDGSSPVVEFLYWQ